MRQTLSALPLDVGVDNGLTADIALGALLLRLELKGAHDSFRIN
jgi:hypothetical protein